MFYQKTIRSAITCSGIGLHSGKKAHLTLKPAAVDSGIIFRRVDLPLCPTVAAKLRNVTHVNYATSLCESEVAVKTVEHLLAALAGLGVDNLMVELDGDEVPIMDGSAAPFVYLLHEAGLKVQSKPRTFIKIKKTIEVSDGEKYVKISPYDDLKIDYKVDFSHPLLKEQSYCFEWSEEGFAKKIARARTFGFLREIELLRKNGLAKGGSLDNAIVIGDYSILNGSLRFEEELVCHKIMDSIGDFYLLGMPIVGHVEAYKAGHLLHSELGRKIEKEQHKWVPLSGIDYLKQKRTAVFSQPVVNLQQQQQRVAFMGR